MYGVSAAQHLRRLERVEEVLVADGAIALHAIGHADVLQLDAVASATGIAVEKVVFAPHTANAALGTVELLLAKVVIVEAADFAVEAPKFEQQDVHAGPAALLLITLKADDALHRVTIHEVLLVRISLGLGLDQVVAEAAREELTTARRSQLAPSLVVHNPRACAAKGDDGNEVVPGVPRSGLGDGLPDGEHGQHAVEAMFSGPGSIPTITSIR
eukprot:CAMPEP_0115840908 /NCGR_PEP_ID=MMETSP0287-20121206/7014_1 /TAXON_ID=412157 /ORGANISM="Chrysochromulina rotalis, Strain UIO044" /LENGTH=213 /DNA_ID=CAMNT_0003294535 /DNA_START=91 /DNA_END=729 /DNA_ORIENTATION=-